ncbi:hypothetical protein [Cyanobium sp. PCC 7001]|uniref:hypothetical protein n=1 Tax=Cyanobium sp. PCC 7001 TaxID=180281 RepID=UPI0012E9DBB9|nr:hypothetical protein [Cyanobium sp. PCC 7001]
MQALESLALTDQFLDERDFDLSAADSYVELTDFPVGREYDDRLYLYNKLQLESAYKKSSTLPKLDYYPELGKDRELEIRFSRLYSQWKAETAGISSIQKVVLNPHYLKIIGMGKPVIPLILNALAQRPDHWFVALSALTDDNPTAPGDNLVEAVSKWLKWGVSKGYLKP